MIEAGAIPIAKTNVPQTMFSFECNNPLWGRTLNPHNPDFTCGGMSRFLILRFFEFCIESMTGSSGGEGAMLALSGSVLGLGSDIGGSLRIPAAYCGIYSLKPAKGRISGVGARGKHCV
jgi:Asp-tRNA(Asn)/Glu-tRNA(Gln) amidotransferase A subunit family amidase